jgi:hypothetical protein
MLSHQQARNDISGKKTIILNPTTDQKVGTETVTFAEGVCSHMTRLTTGNIFFGYSCVYWDRSRSSNNISYHDLFENRLDVSPQIEEFSRCVQRDTEEIREFPV